MGGRGATSGMKSGGAPGGGGGGSAEESKSRAAGGASSKQYDVDTSYTSKEVDSMSRKKLESLARKIAANQAMSREGISREEATRRADLLMSSNTSAQLRKLIKNYKKRSR